jgi:hypothetical protein
MKKSSNINLCKKTSEQEEFNDIYGETRNQASEEKDKEHHIDID